MAERVIERRETESPRETVVVNDHDRYAEDRGSNVGLIVAIIIVILLLLLLFGRGLLGGGGGGTPTVPTNVKVQTPSTPSGQ